MLKTCSLTIFVAYRSRMSDDFRGFSITSSFLRVILNGSRKQSASKHVHFLNLVWFRAIVVRKPMKLRQTSSLAKSSFGFMHKLCWLNAQISCCLANEVLPLEGGKFVFCCFLATKTVWLFAKIGLAKFRNRFGKLQILDLARTSPNAVLA